MSGLRHALAPTLTLASVAAAAGCTAAPSRPAPQMLRIGLPWMRGATVAALKADAPGTRCDSRPGPGLTCEVRNPPSAWTLRIGPCPISRFYFGPEGGLDDVRLQIGSDALAKVVRRAKAVDGPGHDETLQGRSATTRIQGWDEGDVRILASRVRLAPQPGLNPDAELDYLDISTRPPPAPAPGGQGSRS